MLCFCCKSSYDIEKQCTTSFKFATDNEKKKFCVRNFYHDNFIPSTAGVVCIKHFDERFIIREGRIKGDDSTQIVEQKKINNNRYNGCLS